MTKKQMMIQAHKLASKLVAKTGNYAIALKFALKKIWAMAKAGRKRMSESAFKSAIYDLTHKPYNGPAFFWCGKMGIPEWLMAKNLNQSENQGAHLAYSIYAKRETTKAVLIEFETEFGNITMWAPKSVVKGF
ncbi:hypothetical protein [Limosilactobacillus fermentum]|uniref:hypothetical protein n=1 Tax=Limosilactobacillus fermentum TaxID=1613 RepID=UPI000FECDBD5|nr:hypothetical protein [Limosilactobacillus fermentum]QAR22358.1 hypothetical protein EQG50_07815 [Limosilactobacillus fermentum]